MRVALSVGRCQPLHFGHTSQIDTMIDNFEIVYFCLGSCDKGGKDFRNPWTFEQRKQMIKNVYGDRIKILPLSDLGTSPNTDEWAQYVINKVIKISNGKHVPTDFYSGSLADASWYTNLFHLNGNPIEETHYVNGILRKLHIINRQHAKYNGSATDIRTYLSLNNDEWKKYVPPQNISLIQETFKIIT